MRDFTRKRCTYMCIRFGVSGLNEEALPDLPRVLLCMVCCVHEGRCRSFFSLSLCIMGACPMLVVGQYGTTRI